MSLKWLSYLLKRQYSQNTASLFQKIPLWSQKVERCLCLVQNQALIEHCDHEVQSKLYRQINTSYACTFQTVNNLAGQENHPHSDSCGFVETSKPPTSVLQKNIGTRQTFYSSFVRKKHCRALSKLSSTKHRPGQDKSLKLTRSQKAQLNYFISSFRDYINIKFKVSDHKELLYFMYFSAKRKNMFSQILRWPGEGRKHIVISLVHHGIVRE